MIIHFYEFDALKGKTFHYVHESIECSYYDTFLMMLRYLLCYVSYHDTLLWKLQLILALCQVFIKLLQSLKWGRFDLNESCRASVPN